MRNIRLVISYDGTDFQGWQRQPNVPTIQEAVESAVERIVGAHVSVSASGRTDAGVHAANQVANFTTESPIPCANLAKALNDLLPPSVRVKEAREAAATFHARHDARSKTYRYRILQAPVASPFIARFVHHYPYPLDRQRMAEAARWLVGEHDFTSFAASEGKDDESPDGLDTNPRKEEAGSSHIPPIAPLSSIHHSPFTIRHSDRPHSAVRVIYTSRLFWRPRTLILIYEVRGNGFLHHMVRNIVGTLLEVGRGKLAPGDIPRILDGRDRTQAGPTAPASGLCLMRVEY